MGDTDEDGLLDFREFATYCAEHEKKLWLVFQGLDTNQDGGGDICVFEWSRLRNYMAY